MKEEVCSRLAVRKAKTTVPADLPGNMGEVVCGSESVLQPPRLQNIVVGKNTPKPTLLTTAILSS